MMVVGMYWFLKGITLFTVAVADEVQALTMAAAGVVAFTGSRPDMLLEAWQKWHNEQYDLEQKRRRKVSDANGMRKRRR